jgi:hypothetical protein
MKRSEMIAAIEYCLPIKVLYAAGIDSLELADTILNVIEEQGMLPPPMEGRVRVEVEGDNVIIPMWGWENE